MKAVPTVESLVEQMVDRLGNDLAELKAAQWDGMSVGNLAGMKVELRGHGKVGYSVAE